MENNRNIDSNVKIRLIWYPETEYMSHELIWHPETGNKSYLT